MITPELAYTVLRRMPTRSALGPSGFQPSHLQTLIAIENGLKPLAQLLSIIADGEGPTLLRNSRLIGIAKQVGGVRPIAISEVISRLTAIALNELIVRESDLLFRNQLNQVKDGALLGAYVIPKSIENGKLMVAIYATNAFNSLSRMVLITTTKQTIVVSYII